MILWLLSLIVLFYITNRLYFKRKWEPLTKLPGLKPFPVVGNATEIVWSTRPKSLNLIAYFFQRMMGKMLLFQKEKLFIQWIASKPIVFLLAPETAEPILSSNTALEKGGFYRLMKTWLANGLVMSSGDKWRRHRKLLTPSFHFRILDNFIPIMNEQAALLVEKIRTSSCTREWIDSFEFYSKCTMDVICETSMGIKIGAQESDSTYTRMIHNVSYAVTKRVSQFWAYADFIYFLTRDGKKYRKAVEYLHNTTNKVISEKVAERKNLAQSAKISSSQSENGAKKRLAFLDLLLESGMSKQEIREQVDTFMFAGHDTTATALSWMTYLLGLHLDIQKKLLEEVDGIFEDDKYRHVTQEDLRELRYMDMVMKESQRVYPSVPAIGRTLDQDTEIGGYMIPKGTECYLSIYGVHHNSDHYPNPEVFDPDRFTPENSVGRHPYAFVPFSAGPRNCIGQRFALMEQKIIACHVLRHFRIKSLDQRDLIKLVPELVLRTDTSIRTQFILRT